MKLPAAASLLSLTLCAGTALCAVQPGRDQQRDQNQPQEAPEALTQGEKDVSVSLSLRGEAIFSADTDFDGDIGEFSLNEYAAGVDILLSFRDAGRLNIGLEAGLLDYDVTPSASSVAGDAASIGAELDDVQTYAIQVIYSDRFDEATSWFAGGGVSAAMEEDADFGDSVDWLVIGGVSHKFSDKLELGVGVLAKSRLDDDVLVIPIPQIRYTFNERWSLQSQGAGLKLNYKASEALSFGLTAEYDSTTFRLDDTHAAVPEGAATHRRIPVAAYVAYSPNKRFQISAQLGTALGGELEFLDTDGDEVTSQDLDAAIFGGINLSIRF